MQGGALVVSGDLMDLSATVPWRKRRRGVGKSKEGRKVGHDFAWSKKPPPKVAE